MLIRYNFFPILLFICLSFNVFSQNNNTTIKGTVKNAGENKKIFISSSYGGGISDSTIIKSGKFEFNFDLNDPEYLRINGTSSDGKLNGRYIIITPGLTKIKIKEYNDIKNLVVIKGSDDTFDQEKYFDKYGFKRKKRAIKNYPNTFLSFLLTYEFRKSIKKNQLIRYLNEFGSKYKEHRFYKEILRVINNDFVIEKGVKFPDFTIKDKKGDEIKLRNFKGAYLLIQFTASWCGPCKLQIPYQKEAYKKFRDKNFDILWIYLDSKEKMTTSIKKNKIIWNSGYSKNKFKSDIAYKLKINSIPDLFLLNPKGEIIEFTNSSLKFEVLNNILSEHIK